jgi:Protein of unknown function (DUF465)
MHRVVGDIAGSGQGANDPGVGLQQEIARLRLRHGEIEHRLQELGRHLSLTLDEQLERAELKKEKLWSKDRIVALTHLLQAA